MVAAAPVVAAAPAEPKAPALKAKDVTCDATAAGAATFATGSASLTPAERTLLNAVVQCITGQHEVGEHTDKTSGSSSRRNSRQIEARTIAGDTYHRKKRRPHQGGTFLLLKVATGPINTGASSF